MDVYQAYLILLQLKGAHIQLCFTVKWQRNEWKWFYNTVVATDLLLQGPVCQTLSNSERFVDWGAL